MAVKKNSPVDKMLGRFDHLDEASRHNLIQRLARERALLEAVFNTLQEGVLVIDGSGMIEYANEAAARLIGAKHPATGETLWRLVPGLRDTLPIETPLGPVVTREFELVYPSPRVVRLYLVPFEDPVDGSQRSAIILSDITAEKKSTAELIENEKTSSILLLAAGVAHELGNPLNSLTIHLQLIERRLRKLSASKEARSLEDSIKVCRDEVARLDGIIKNFLEAIRPRMPDLSEVYLPDLIGEVLTFQAKELADRGIAVDGDIPAATPVIMGDRDQLKQAFFNLIKNAMEAMQPGGKLNLRVRTGDDFVYVAIADTGSGIKADDLSKLFQPYHTTKVSGHGLGLMIVQRILRDHGGQVAIESKEGAGTVVTLQLPQKHRRVKMLAGG